MKRSVKFILALVLLATGGLNLVIDANGNINLRGAKAAAAQDTTGEAQKWKLETVHCIDDDGEIYATAEGCFDGKDISCTPTSCPPQPSKPSI